MLLIKKTFMKVLKKKLRNAALYAPMHTNLWIFYKTA